MAEVLRARFGEGSGSSTANAITPAHTGTLRGTTLPSWQDAPSPDGGSYLYFNGDEGGSVVEFPEHATTMITGELSAVAWVRTAQTFPGAPATYTQKEILARGGGNFSLGWEEDAVDNFVWLRCYIRAVDSDYFELEYRDDDPQPGFRDDEWHLVIVRFRPSSDAGTSDGSAQLLVDGVVKDTEAHSLHELKVSGVEDLWAVGGRVNSTTKVIDRNLIGDIQLVRLFDHWLEDWEINDMTAKTKAQLETQIDSLFPDNTSGDISPQDLRNHMDDQTDSFAIEGILERSANEAQYRISHVEEDISSLTGASVDSTIEVPAGARLLGIGVAVTTLITGATSLGVRYLAAEGSVPRTFRGCLLKKSADQTGLTAGTTALTWDQEDYDTDSFHDVSSNTERITIPVGSGIKRIRLYGAARSNDVTGEMGLLFRKNGTNLFQGGGQQENEGTTSEAVIAISAIVDVTEGDYFQLGCVTTSTRTVSSGERTYFGMEVIEMDDIPVMTGVAVAATTQESAVVDAVPNTAARKIRLEAEGSNFTAGAVRVTAFYEHIVAPNAS